MGSIGDKITKAAVGLIVGLMVLSFAVWGMEDVFSAGGRNAVVTLGDEPITSDEFEDAFRREVNILNAEREQGLTNEEAFRLGVHRNVLDRLVTARAIDIDAEELGIGVDNKLARDVVRDMPAFRNPVTGEIDLEALDLALRNQRITRAQFEKDIVDSLRREQTVPAIVEGIAVPDSFAEQRFRFLSEQRAAEVLTLPGSSAGEIAPPTEAELEAWITDNARLYTAPEFRRFQALRVEPFDLSPDLSVTEEDLKAAYDYRLSLPPSSSLSISSPETRTVVQVQLADEAEARAAAERIAAGEDPAQVAASLGAEAPTTYTDVLKSRILDTNVAAAAYAMEEGAAQAVEGTLGFWFAVAVPEVVEAVRPSFEEIREELSDELLRETALDRLFDVVTDIEDLMDDNRTLEEISTQLGIPISIYDFLDRSGTTEDGLRMAGFARIPGVASDDAILREVFTNDVGFETDLFETGNDGYAAIEVIDIKDSTLRPMEEIREKAIADYRADKVNTALRELATDIQRRVRAGENLRDIAAELGLEVEREILVRTAQNPALGPEVSVGMLDGSVGDVSRGPGPLPQTQQVAVLARIQGTADTLAGEFADVLNSQARNAIAADIQTAYRAAILAENPVAQNDDRIRQVLGIDAPQ